MVSPDSRQSFDRLQPWSNHPLQAATVVAVADAGAAVDDGTSVACADPAQIYRRTHSHDCPAT